MTTQTEALKLVIDALENNRQTHHYCEDTWYSCPKHEDGCANESEGNECNCGADKANAEIDKTITDIKEALDRIDTAPVAKNESGRITWLVNDWPQNCLLYTTPPQRKPLTDEQLDKAGMKLAECMYYPWEYMPEEGKRNMRDLAKAIIEAAHGIKE